MTGGQLRKGRQHKRWTQAKAAAKLGVSQPYLALMESGWRRVPDRLARRAARLYELSPVVLPLETGWAHLPRWRERELAAFLAGLGYPGLAWMKPARTKNPAEVLLAALSYDDLESRLTEALPWVALQYPDLDWDRLVPTAQTLNLQNRLGFVTTLARRLAEQRGDQAAATLLAQPEARLDQAKLVREDTLCHCSLSEAERRWLRGNRPADARHWNLLTDLSPEHLRYAV